MAGFKENAPGLLACVLVLMIPGYVTLGLRVYVRLSKKAWGPDDWCMAYAGVSITSLSQPHRMQRLTNSSCRSLLNVCPAFSLPIMVWVSMKQG